MSNNFRELTIILLSASGELRLSEFEFQLIDVAVSKWAEIAKEGSRAFWKDYADLSKKIRDHRQKKREHEEQESEEFYPYVGYGEDCRNDRWEQALFGSDEEDEP
ncbi:MAG: hypothetical protein J7545_15610 [Roseofilum sp. SBFL]|uniref:hypothetical protein n=1 Tax=Roseofilum sp. SBFL TaxID=2821496 RepID=UPI001B2BE123|nr:hypothetical protein [Roseofilum sp. SBFL]MBP0043374.1 hypothetical protein [Roseofilum sp. SBFL]